MKKRGSTGQFFIVSISLTAIILLVMGAYIAYTDDDQPSDAFLKVQDEVRPPEQTRDVIAVTKSAIPAKATVYTEDVLLKPRAAATELPRITAVTVLKFPDFTISREAHDVSKMMIIRELIPSGAAPEGVAGENIMAVRSPMRPKHTSIEHFTRELLLRLDSVADVDSVDAALAIYIGGAPPVEPLPKGEPGGRVIGRRKDIRGVFRLVRVHHDLSDWWADQSSLVALVNWLNTHTKIKSDMCVEGGAVRLTDPKLSKAPLVFFTGHDPAMARSRNLMRGGRARRSLSEPEREALRRYLVEDGGFIFFDDCGVDAPTRAITRLFLAQLRQVMPEYGVDRIPDDHEIYSNFYEMGGPPAGFDIFWWGTHPPRRNFLEGITIADHLGVMVCERDYMCSMETVSLPTRAVPYNPGVYRFCTNVVIYALTHGGISDYSHYVPEDRATDEISTDDPVLVPPLK